MKVTLDVLGTPAPKGSSRAFMTRGPNPRAVLAPSGSKVNAANLKGWDHAVRLAANERCVGLGAPIFIGRPLRLTIVFRLKRPAGHWGARGLKPSAPMFPATKPDLDKLVRATADSLQGTVFDDDSRIVSQLSHKIYAGAEGREGAEITIEAIG